MWLYLSFLRHFCRVDNFFFCLTTKRDISYDKNVSMEDRNYNDFWDKSHIFLTWLISMPILLLREEDREWLSVLNYFDLKTKNLDLVEFFCDTFCKSNILLH